ncbi:multiubiquitin domain-containing protein [Agromyces sp. NPDC058104]|uniref:multiubiquitin domain-containing protein n=1 Tax=Agromyces sp. NPDC058104 TaxID=3346342 RepID=UPI0036DD12EC
MTVAIDDTAKKPAPKLVQVIFNKTKTIELPKGKLTGLEIKQHAINQGVQIQLSYVLFLIKNKNHRQVIGDTDVVTIREGLEFAAVTDDDNS